MPRYFFDIHQDAKSYRDDIGHELPDLDAARKEAMRALPEIAYDEIAKDGDRQTFVVLVTGEDGRPLYSATLSFAGQWLVRHNG